MLEEYAGLSVPELGSAGRGIVPRKDSLERTQSRTQKVLNEILSAVALPFTASRTSVSCIRTRGTALSQNRYGCKVYSCNLSAPILAYVITTIPRITVVVTRCSRSASAPRVERVCKKATLSFSAALKGSLVVVVPHAGGRVQQQKPLPSPRR